MLNTGMPAASAQTNGQGALQMPLFLSFIRRSSVDRSPDAVRSRVPLLLRATSAPGFLPVLVRKECASQGMHQKTRNDDPENRNRGSVQLLAMDNEFPWRRISNDQRTTAAPHKPRLETGSETPPRASPLPLRHFPKNPIVHGWWSGNLATGLSIVPNGRTRRPHLGQLIGPHAWM